MMAESASESLQLDYRFDSCSCPMSGNKVSVDRVVALNLCEKEVTCKVMEKRLEVLQHWDFTPFSEEFQGDVRLLGCDEQPVYAHRFILASKSSVFRRMFETDMEEKRSGVVRIADTSAPVLKTMVNYCYTAEVRFTTEAPAEEVLKIADKYNIHELKTICSVELSKDMNIDNFCDKMMLAELYHAEELGNQLARFFSKDGSGSKVFPTIAKRLSKRGRES